MAADDLAALLNSRRWVKRRVDRVEFRDLTAVRRTIALTLDLDELACARSSCCVMPTGCDRVPLGWFAPWANAGAVLVDADQRVIPYLTSRESDREVKLQIKGRLDALQLREDLRSRLDTVLEHRRDPGRPGDRCPRCTCVMPDAGPRELMTDKWGCRAVLDLLHRLRMHRSHEQEVEELTRILLAWQRNFVLFARLDASSMRTGLVTLQLSYDEELLPWEPPWEHRRRVLRPQRLRCRQPMECRAAISRGGPFSQDLDEMAPTGFRCSLARSQSPWLRKLGRRGFLHVAWHVAWHQAGGLDVPHHHVDVVLPDELSAVRMRMLRMTDGVRCATVADQVGSRATIVAPTICDKPNVDPHQSACDKRSGEEQRPDCEGKPSAFPQKDGAWSPTLFSLVITQHSPASWYGGAWIASLTGVALILLAALWLPKVMEDADAGAAALLLAPALVSTVLSVRAASEIAGQLATALRGLIGAVGVLAVSCALALIALDDLWALRSVWVVAGVALLGIAAALHCGGRRIKCLLAYGRRPSPRYVRDSSPGKVLTPDDDAPWIPPPDCWLNVDEGDLVPWGWLSHASSRGGIAGSDDSFWSRVGSPREDLVHWVQGIVRYKEPKTGPPPCPQCRC